ncbi:hypothetical protein EV421DRAFT_1938948 [Armillaria borealis]|uniref:Fungal-type protein kinase domain-containing protein n=1 Tax=Armillaria borealis TaxID=47425 RepID=A0AA39MT34_9AGAR|nr:hypothetical protein EV421DRAFT_1938948 [Armillaria borealis]
MNKYIAALADPKKREHDLYQPFKDICDNIIDRFSELEHLPDQLNRRIGPWHGKGDAQLVDGTKRGVRKVDFLFLYSFTLAYKKGIRNLWGPVVFPMEVAKSKKGQINNEEEEEDVLGEMRAPVKVTGRHKAGAQSHQPHAVKNIAPPPPSRDVVSVGPVAIPLTSKSQKRTREDGNEAGGVDSTKQRVSKRARVTNKVTQLASYALECAVATYRMFVTSIALRDTDITMWYHDPMGAFHSVSFNFEFKPKYLILVLYAMCVCTPERAGFSPFLDPPTFPDDEESNWKGRRFVFTNETGTEPVFTINGNLLFLAHEFQGRRTFVAPVEPDGEVEKTFPPLVLKFQWPSRNSPATEPQLIREILAAAPELKKHLPKFIFRDSTTQQPIYAFLASILSLIATTTKGRWSIAIFWSLLVVDVGDFMKSNLWANSRKFLLILLNVRTGSLTKLLSLMVLRLPPRLHERESPSDVSEGNVMFYRDEEDIAMGLLSDFDNASRVDEQSDIIGSSMKQRTGTVLFMALDILKNVGTPVPHLYRHDLESFVYLLVWSGVHFDLKNGICCEFDLVLKCWDAKLWI